MTGAVGASQKEPRRNWANAPKVVADLLVGWMVPFHDGRGQLHRDEAMRSIDFDAGGKDVGTGLTRCYNFDKVAEVLVFNRFI